MNKSSDELTRLRQEIQTLANECAQLKSLIESVPGDIYWKDKNGVWLGVNKRGEETLKRMGFIKSRKDIVGKTDCDLFDKDTSDRYRANDLEVMEQRTEISREERVTLPNGVSMVQLSTKRPIFDVLGNVTGIVGNTVDITYLKKIESELKKANRLAEAANKAKDEFISNMEHDLRTPLSGIEGIASAPSTFNLGVN